jgi:hypothetical protein
MIGGQFKLGGSQQGAGQTGSKEGQQEPLGVLQQGDGFWLAVSSSGVKRTGKFVLAISS